jgi:hypothetical protein
MQMYLTPLTVLTALAGAHFTPCLTAAAALAEEIPTVVPPTARTSAAKARPTFLRFIDIYFSSKYLVAEIGVEIEPTNPGGYAAILRRTPIVDG